MRTLKIYQNQWLEYSKKLLKPELGVLHENKSKGRRCQLHQKQKREDLQSPQPEKTKKLRLDTDGGENALLHRR
jgi:hypothetical protein